MEKDFPADGTHTDYNAIIIPGITQAEVDRGTDLVEDLNISIRKLKSEVATGVEQASALASWAAVVEHALQLGASIVGHIQAKAPDATATAPRPTRSSLLANLPAVIELAKGGDVSGFLASLKGVI